MGLEDRILKPFFSDAQRSLYPGFIVIENSEGVWEQDLSGELARRGYIVLKRCKMNLVYALDS